MSTLMRAVGFNSPGLVENLFIANRPIPVPKSGECLLKIYYSAINRADTLQRRGMYPVPPGESDILGLEAVGIVEQPSESSKWKKNDRVMALLGGGGNAEYVTVNENHLIRIPDWMSWTQAAAIPEAWLTAFQLVYWISSITKPSYYENSRKSIDQLRVLVHAGASGVGTSLIQILNQVLKVKEVYATVGSEKKKEYLEKELKVTKAFNYKLPEEQNFDQLILDATNKTGVDLIFDCVGASHWERNTNCMSMDSEWVLFGSMGGTSVNGDILARIMRKRIHIKGTTLRNRSADYKHELIKDFESKLLNHFKDGTLKTIIERVFPLDQIAEAHKLMESNESTGKIVLQVVDDETDKKAEL